MPIDEVRRQEEEKSPELTRSRYLWLKNPGTLSAGRRRRAEEAEIHLADWVEMGINSGLEPSRGSPAASPSIGKGW